MTPSGPKPRLVFFQWNHQPNAAASGFLKLHMDLHVQCLAEFFEVTVVSEDCDYDAVCDRHAPDLALFEAGYRSHGSRRIRIANTQAHPKVPKLGLHNGDPWCDRRAGFLSDMDDWGIETFFAIGTATPGYMPEVADRMFVWPNFIDPEMFCKARADKVIPVMLTGQTGPLYPWRSAVHDTLAARYPCLVTPPFRYEDSGARRLLSGRSYANALSASWLSPSCGTMGHELVRKHLEIPGAGCLLVTERTPVLEAAGYLDGRNCVFADPADVVEKVDALMADPEKMHRIIAAGQTLVHERHTLRQRAQIREWFELQRNLGPGERIIQPSPFAPLMSCRADGFRGHGHLSATGLDRVAIAQGEACLARGDIAGARAAYAAALAMVTYLPEALLGLVRCDLAEGKPSSALRRVSAMIRITVTEYGASHPDPVEWALCLVALLACGRQAEAVALRHRYPQARHRELSHVQRVLDGIAGMPAPAHLEPIRPRGSIHAVPPRGAAEFDRWLHALLRRCGHPLTAARRARRGAPGAIWLERLDRSLGLLGAAQLRPALPPAPGFGYLEALRDSVGRRILPPPARRRVRKFALWLGRVSPPPRNRPESRP